jgi:hypothetical protein
MGLDQNLISNKRGVVITWRKANQIHGWFDQRLNGVENVTRYSVKSSDLVLLLDNCIRVKEQLIAGGTKLKEQIVERIMKDGEIIERSEPQPVYVNTALAEQLLPPTPGFFFGSYEYDQWYLNDIDFTIEQLMKILSTKEKSERFYYEAWW